MFINETLAYIQHVHGKQLFQLSLFLHLPQASQNCLLDIFAMGKNCVKIGNCL